MKSSDLGFKLSIFWLTSISVSLAIAVLLESIDYFARIATAQEIPTVNVLPESIRSSNILQICQPITVRVVKANSAGSGVIVGRSGNVYSVLTNWHVVESHNPIILTVDDLQHSLISPPQHIGDVDLALLQFYSDTEYPVAQIEPQIPQIGDTVYTAGFPLTIGNNENTVALGNQAFRLIAGEVSIVPVKSLPQGYRLGYTNDTEVGMSGSPVFSDRGLLVGIHGRGKYRDPGFGVYLFEDGSDPSPEQLEQMIESSWGIPIGTYFELIEQ